MEENEHAYKLIEYQITRGGKVILNNILAPLQEDNISVLKAFKIALDLEQSVYESLLNLHENADAAFADFLEEKLSNK